MASCKRCIHWKIPMISASRQDCGPLKRAQWEVRTTANSSSVRQRRVELFCCWLCLSVPMKTQKKLLTSQLSGACWDLDAVSLVFFRVINWWNQVKKGRWIMINHPSSNIKFKTMPRRNPSFNGNEQAHWGAGDGRNTLLARVFRLVCQNLLRQTLGVYIDNLNISNLKSCQKFPAMRSSNKSLGGSFPQQFCSHCRGCCLQPSQKKLGLGFGFTSNAAWQLGSDIIRHPKSILFQINCQDMAVSINGGTPSHHPFHWEFP